MGYKAMLALFVAFAFAFVYMWSLPTYIFYDRNYIVLFTVMLFIGFVYGFVRYGLELEMGGNYGY